jgi:hypothetical protein
MLQSVTSSIAHHGHGPFSISRNFLNFTSSVPTQLIYERRKWICPIDFISSIIATMEYGNFEYTVRSSQPEYTITASCIVVA